MPNDSAQKVTPSSTSWRVFCAITLPPELRERVQVHIARLRESVPEARASWNRDDKLHLTIKFLGDIDADRVPALSLAAERAVAGMKPISLIAEGCGAFPDRGRPRVLWIGIVNEDEGLARLNERLETECAAHSFPREPRAFRPHLTIARVRQPAAALELAGAHRQMGFPSLRFEANELVVIRSELSGAGSRYTDISRHQLGLSCQNRLR